MKHTASQTTKDELIASMKRALGPVWELLKNPDVTDIEFNSTDSVVHFDGRSGRQELEESYSHNDAERFVNTVASYHGEAFNDSHPRFAGRLPKQLFSCRLQATRYPITERAGIVLRKPGNLYPIDDYVNTEVKGLLHEALRNKKNILLAGSTGAGKTSFLNSVVHELQTLIPDDRLNILEDTREIQCDSKNHELLKTVKGEQAPVEISMSDLIEISLRLNPDRIIVGEVRGVEAYDVLTAWDTGHDGGICTFHAGGARKGFDRFFRLTKMPDKQRSYQFAANAIDYIFFLSKEHGQRAVREVVRVSYNRDKRREQFAQVYPSRPTNQSTNTKAQSNGHQSKQNQ